ncbi:GDSL-type esterase/lipase family protein [Arenibaculum pallidiluteum]|uniref:GDSL-type esterase/lipase family protein n=1 Tax=Arenibaculum pallidiluteum TaxID=2812559 RepID=UPI001A964B3D|nr:GDSL-type esterase/lipase family protein [Arenibaculum pallidiluteum]
MATYTGTSGNDTFQHRNGLDTFDGGAGIDTIDFTKANGPVDVALSSGTAFMDASAARPIKLMPMGASLTRGYVQTNPLVENGGYRTELYKLFQADGKTVNFVGTQQHGPSTLPDRDHQGSPGQQIDWMTPRATDYLNKTQPDGVLLLMGTNDVRSSDTLQTILQQMSDLIDTVATHESRPKIFLASLPPIDPRTHTQAQIDKLNAFNAALPDLVAQKKALGYDIVFVSMASLTLDDISDPPNDTGVHATPEGYKKIADAWYTALKAAGMTDAVPGEIKVTDTLKNIENVTGSQYYDHVHGDSKANVIHGLGGDDLLSGLGGNDKIYGGSGNDRLMGGSGNDIMEGGDGDDRLAGDTGADTMTGGKGADAFILRPGESNGDWITDFQEGVDTFEFKGFSRLKQSWDGDTLVLTHATGVERVKVTKVSGPQTPPPDEPEDNTIYGTEGNDNMAGDNNANVMNGRDGDDSITSYRGADILYGGAGNDRLMGGADNDKLFGGEGNDRLAGDTGADEMTGGAGADAFILRKGETTGDLITDFETGVDKLELRGFGSGAKLVHADDDNWTVTYTGGSETLKIAGVTSLAPGDYLFI